MTKPARKPRTAKTPKQRAEERLALAKRQYVRAADAACAAEVLLEHLNDTLTAAAARLDAPGSEGSPMSRAGGYEATEASLPEWTRPEVIDWTTPDEFSRGKQPADLPLPPRTAPRMMRRIGRDGWVTDGGEVAALPDAARVRGVCTATCRTPSDAGYYICTRPDGHGGRHRADAGRIIVASWR